MPWFEGKRRSLTLTMGTDCDDDDDDDDDDDGGGGGGGRQS